MGRTHIEHQEINGIEHKWCNKCKQWKPLSGFSKTKNRWDGLDTICKECHNKYSQNWFQLNKEEKSEQRKESYKRWYFNNKEHKDEYNKQYLKQYYIDNREKLLENKKQKYRTIERYCYCVRWGNLREDRRKGRCGADEDPLPPLEYYIEQISTGIDYYDGMQYPFNELGFDRRDDSKPHTIDNMVVATTKHNIDRYHKQMTVEEYRDYILKQNEELE